MTFREQLKKLEACQESLKWVGNKTIEQAWKTCKNSDWMIWVLNKTNLDLIDPICDMAEEVLHLVPEDSQLACIWAISAAKRRASKDELDAAWGAAWVSSYACHSDAAYNAAASAADAAYVVASDDFAADAVYYAYAAASARAAAASDDDDDDAYFREKKKQCAILRKYFTIDQVREAFNKLVS